MAQIRFENGGSPLLYIKDIRNSRLGNVRNVNKWGVLARPIEAVAAKFKNAAIWPNQPAAAKTAEI